VSESQVNIEKTTPNAIVSLRVSKHLANDAKERLQLAAPLQTAGLELQSLWLAPDQWLLISESQTPEAIIKHCEKSLDEILHIALDYTSALQRFRISGRDCRDILASGCGLDLRPQYFASGACASTRLAQIAAIIVACRKDQYDLYVDCCYTTYLTEWLSDAIVVMELCISD